MKVLCKSARRDAGHADRTGVRVLVTGRVAEEVRSKKTHALLSSGIKCAAWAWDGQQPPRMDTVACSCAMSNYDTCADAGMLLLPHGTHKHLRRACARLAGARTTSGCLLPAVRWWRLRGCAPAVPVLLDARINARCGHGSLAALHYINADA